MIVGVPAPAASALARYVSAQVAARRVLPAPVGSVRAWSVAVAALPAEGFPAFERWALVDDRDIRWVVRENLRKKRLIALDPDRVARLAASVGR